MTPYGWGGAMLCILNKKKVKYTPPRLYKHSNINQLSYIKLIYNILLD